MRKNVASQKVGAQMLSATDGSAFTGSVTVYVTVDAGTQAVGSVGSGACTHKGNGYHTYAPSQAETNGNIIAFTFVGTGAIPVTVQVETVSFDPHDTVRLGLTALPNAAADAAGGLPISDAGGLDLDAQRADVAAILVDTGTTLDARIPAALVGGRMDASVGAMANNVVTAAAVAASALNGKGDWLLSASYTAPLDAAGTRSAVGLASANLDTQLSTIDTVADAVKAKTDNLPSSPAAVGSAMTLADGAITAAKVATGAIDADALAADAANEIADAILDRSSAIDGYTPREIMRLIAAALAGKLSGGATTTNTVRDLTDAKNRIVATVDESGNRTAITLDLT